MTGYGCGSVTQNGYEVTAEIRGVNHRFFECSVKVPRNYGYLDEKIKSFLQPEIARGKVEVSVTLQPVDGTSVEVQVNHEAVTAYLCALMQENVQLNRVLGDDTDKGFLKDDLTLSTLLRLPNVFQVQQATEDAEVVWAATQPALELALEQFLAMRQAEGVRMQADIVSHLDALEQMTKQVEVLVPESVQQYYDKLYRKITELLENRTIEESRLVTEVAIVAEKIAVDEELVRLHSHIAQFRTLLESDAPVGRKMDFLVQELNREVNTTGSKSQSLEITRLVVDMKAEIEKIREQIQNIE
jgi:uncharacterized protein (TIGR00255 family)